MMVVPPAVLGARSWRLHGRGRLKVQKSHWRRVGDGVMAAADSSSSRLSAGLRV